MFADALSAKWNVIRKANFTVSVWVYRGRRKERRCKPVVVMVTGVGPS